ncbi:MAG TPA: hypothetical protein VMI12_06035 [Puia sp.]|nr:hypothetical protein [Puia sp.]
MKALYLYIVFQFGLVNLWAENGHENNAVNTANTLVSSAKAKEGSAQFRFRTKSFNQANKDSVLVIYDRFDRSGAGIIHKIYYPSSDHTISINGIPAGKYFVTIQCLGMHRDHIEKVMTIKSNKCETISVRMQDSDEYSKENVVIPVEYTDFSRLKVVSMK